MLKQEDNELLTRTGSGTAGGELMRRYWQPVGLSEEIPAGGDPVPVQVLGEHLVLFRDEHGAPGLIGRQCPHRLADLSYGRIEAGGLRCLYHGWVIGVEGRCLEQPGEVAGSGFKDRVRHTAYPCIEAGQIIFAYMGEGEPPALPRHPFMTADPEQYFVIKQHHACNYLQGLEGYVDPQHLSFLHRFAHGESTDVLTNSMISADASPILETDDTGYGLRIYCIRRPSQAEQYVRITNFIMPNCGTFAGDPLIDPATGKTGEGYSVNWAMPIDDVQHFKYVVIFRTDGPIDRPYMLRSFKDIDKAAGYRSPRNGANRYLQDRLTMDRVFSGMGGNFFDHDLFAVEGMGPIVDRTRENLGATDRVVVAMRRKLLNAVRDVQAGAAPPFCSPATDNTDLLADMVVRAQMMPADRDPRELVLGSGQPARQTIGRLHGDRSDD